MSVKIIQLFEKETSTYTYIVFDETSKEALIIDPVKSCFERDIELIKCLNLDLKYALETHIHADHITGAYLFKDKLNAQIGVSKESKSQCADILIYDGQTLDIGRTQVTCLSTPGHTNTCVSYFVDRNVFTGDALLINGCGRTDFQEGSNRKLFNSIRNKIFSLPNETIIYPGHDYKGYTSSTVGFEKKFNTRLKLDNSFEDFEQIMNSLNLALPQKIDAAVPANINCGRT